jgi:hypothetical protein
MALIVPSILCAGDLSRYREFNLESNLIELAEQAGKKPTDAIIIHEQPALIQELSWQAGYKDTVKEVRFRFYHGALFRMIVEYDHYNTEGLTAQDVIEATSVIYGDALRPTAEITLTSSNGRNETLDVIARWEDADWSFNLVRFKYRSNFTLAAFSKNLDGQAQAAIDEAMRLDKLEAPQRKIDQKNQADLDRAVEKEKVRTANKQRFKP